MTFPINGTLTHELINLLFNSFIFCSSNFKIAISVNNLGGLRLLCVISLTQSSRQVDVYINEWQVIT